MTNDDGWSQVLHRAILLKPSIARLSPKTQASLDAFRAKQAMIPVAKPPVPQDIKKVQAKNVCTKEHPMPQVYRESDGWIHPDAKFHDRDGDFHDDYKCPHCGIHICVEIRNNKP